MNPAIPRVHLVTFGGGGFAYRRAARRLVLQAKSSGIFTTSAYITDKNLKNFVPDFWSMHRGFILESKKGFGFWIWKPAIIARALEAIPEGDLLLYLDAGFELNLGSPGARERWAKYLEAVEEHGSLAFQIAINEKVGLRPVEKYYSKIELVENLKPLETTLDSNQLLAALVFFKNSKASRDFVLSWAEKCIDNNYSLVRDGSLSKEIQGFRSHRHDQSIFSILYKESNRWFIGDETDWKPNWEEAGASFPLWCMRNRSGIVMGTTHVPDFIDRVHRFLLRPVLKVSGYILFKWRNLML